MVIVPLEKLSFAFFGGNVRFLKGERGKPTYWCMLFQTNSPFSFLVFFSFLSVFVLIFFSSPLTLFFFSRCEKSSVFRCSLQGTARASL